MSADDRIASRAYPKVKSSGSWDAVSGTLVVEGSPKGPVEWENSCYRRVGHDLKFFAFVSGSYWVLDEAKRDGYVEPKQYGRGPKPVPGADDEDEDAEPGGDPSGSGGP